MRFQATFIQLAEKPPPPQRPYRENIFRLDLSISCNFKQFWLSWQKSPPSHGQTGKIFRLDLSISCDFKQLWFLWQKSQTPTPKDESKYFLHWIYPFQAISSYFGFCGRKAPLPDDDFHRTGLPAVTKDYLPGTVTHLVFISIDEGIIFILIIQKAKHPETIGAVIALFWLCNLRKFQTV